MNHTPHTPDADALDAYVEALMRCTGTLMLIVDHMAAWDATLPPETPPDDSAPDALRRLVKDVIKPVLGNRAPGGLAEAAQLLARTADVLGRDVFLVDPTDPAAA